MAGNSLTLLLTLFVFLVNFIAFAGTDISSQPPESTSTSRTTYLRPQEEYR